MPDSTTPAPSHWLPRLLQLWAIAALVTFAVMLTHASDEPVFLNRYSTLVTLLFGGLLLLAVGIGAAWMYLSSHPAALVKIDNRLAGWRKRQWFSPVIIGGACLALAGMWLFFLGNHLPTYGFLRMFLGMSILVAALALIYAGTNATPASGQLRFLVPAGVAALLAVAIFTTPYYPNLLKADEAFDFSMARNALENGHVGPMIYRHSHPADYFGGVWTWIWAGWFKVFGVSLTSGRLYTLFLSYVSLILVWFSASRLYDKTTAWYSVLLGAYSFMALNHTRYHIHAAVWLSLGIFFFSLTNRSGRWWAHLLAGFAVGMVVDSNPVAYCFGLGLGLFYLWEYFQKIRHERKWIWSPFWWLALGGFTALSIYLILRSGNAFLKDNTTGSMLSQYSVSSLERLTNGQFLEIARQYFNAFLTNQPILLGLMIIGIVIAMRQNSRNDRFLLILYFTWMFIIIFAYFYFPTFYLLLGLPVFLILAARGLAQGIPALIGSSNNTSTMLQQSIVILMMVWLGAAVVDDIRGLPSQSVEDAVETGQRMTELLPTDALIVGAEPYYFGMMDYPNFVGGSVEVYLMNFKGMTADEAWDYVNPDAVIFSEGWPTEPKRSPALMSYIDEQGFSLLACYQTKSFSRIELWTKTIPAGVTPNETCLTVCNPRIGC